MTTGAELLSTCACHKVRMAARTLTRAYDDSLRPTGLRATQVAVLAAIAAEGAMSIAALAETIGMDRTTLTRNLRPLARAGLVAIGDEGFRRSRTLSLTRRGTAKLQAALPHWQRAQEKLQQHLGKTWAAVHRALEALAGAR